MLTKEKNNDGKRLFAKLLRKIRKNPEEGLHEFHLIYGRLVINTATSICGTRVMADEVLNHVYEKLWNFAQKNQSVENPNGFVYVITVNCAKDLLKERKFVPLNEAITAGKDDIQKVIEKDAFCRLIDFLPAYEQSVVDRKISVQLTFQEIADLDEKPLSTITTIYYRCLQKIKNNIDKNKKN